MPSNEGLRARAMGGASVGRPWCEERGADHARILDGLDNGAPPAARAGEDVLQVDAAQKRGPVDPGTDKLENARAEGGPWRARSARRLGGLGARSGLLALLLALALARPRLRRGSGRRLVRAAPVDDHVSAPW